MRKVEVEELDEEEEDELVEFANPFAAGWTLHRRKGQLPCRRIYVKYSPRVENLELIQSDTARS